MKQFLYFMLNREGKFFYVDANGRVRTTSAPTPIKHAPEGWQEKKMSWGKSVSYLGLTREYSVPLKFTFDGATILRDQRYRYGVEVYVKIVIHKLNKSFGGGLLHEDFTGCEVDFSKWDDQDDYVITELKDGGLPKLVKANENTEYTIDVDTDPDAVTVYLDGISLKTSLTLANFAESFVTTSNSGSNVNGFLMSFYKQVNEGNILGIIQQDVFGQAEGNSPNYSTDDRWWIKATSTISLPFNFKFKFKVIAPPTTGGGGYFKLELVKQDGSIYHSFIDNTFGSGGTSVTHELNQNVTLNLVQDDRLFLRLTLRSQTGITPHFTRLTTEEQYSKVTYTYRYPATLAKGLRLYTLMSRLLDKIAGTSVTLQSNLLQNTKNIVVLSGDSIRKIAGAKIKTSFTNAYKSIRVPVPCGFGIDKIDGIDTAIIEEPEFFFKSDVIYDLGEVVDFKKGNADEWMANVVNVGYPNQTYDEVNGRDEFNVEQTYTTSITRIVKEYDLVSKWRGDCFGQEFLRINLENKTTTDSSSDNDTFFVDIDHLNPRDDGSYPVYRGPYDALTGVISPSTVYNVRLSPKTCLHKHGAWLRSMFFHNEASKFVFGTGDKNSEMHYKLNGKSFTEKSDVVVGDFEPGPIWLPYTFNFTTQIPSHLPTLMNGNSKYGKFKLKDKHGNVWYGYALDVSHVPADDEKQTWKLLASADNDLLKLIR